MVADFNVSFDGLDALTKKFMDLPGAGEKARASALKSTGYMLAQKTKAAISADITHKPISPLTRALRKRNKNKPPLYWLARFAKYRVNSDGTTLQVGFAKSYKKQSKTFVSTKFDSTLDALVARNLHGATSNVSDKVRKSIAAQTWYGKKAKKKVLGKNYFAMRKSTSSVKTPARPIFQLVLKANRRRAVSHFQTKFRKAFLEKFKG